MIFYSIIKVAHVFAIIAWMAGLFYMPRLFVYHSGVEQDSEAAQLFSTMEKRLYLIIMMPAMFLSLATGIILVMIPGVVSLQSGWIHLKLLCVSALVVLHHLYNRWHKSLTKGQMRDATTFFRIINEIPTLLLLIILICVIIKPF